MSTPLTIYGSYIAASTLVNAGQLSTVTGGTDNPSSSKVGTATGYGEATALGSSGAWAAAGSLPAPTGLGWLLDSSLLHSQVIPAGNWTPTITCRITSGTATADIYIRAYAYDTSNSTYTAIGTMTLPGQSLTATKTTYTGGPASLGAFTFNATQKLYIDCFFNVTANSSGSGSANIALRLSSSGTQGFAGDMQIVTPGYNAPAVTTALTFYLANDTSVTLPTADQLYTTGGGIHTTTHDNVVGTSTGYGEICSRSTQAWAGAGSIGSPSGNGWFWNNTLLNGNQFPVGSWSGLLKMQAQQGGGQGGSLTADIYVRVYKYNAGTYTQIVSMLSPAQTIVAGADITIPSATGVLMAFGASDVLYIDIWANVTTNANGATNQAIRLQKLSTDTTGFTGASDASIVSPGYQASPAGGGGGGVGGGSTSFTTYLASAASAVQSRAEQMYSTAGTPSTTNRDVFVGTAQNFGEITSNGTTSGGGAGGATDSPYGNNYYFSGHHGSVNNLAQKSIDILVGGNGEQGLVPGGPIWLRAQLKWSIIEYTQTTPPTYDWSILDDLVSRCNAANILVIGNIMIPPTWRLDIDVNGNSVTAGTGVYASGAATADYAQEYAARYNGTTTNAIHGGAQPSRLVSALQWNEDYDSQGSDAQRTLGGQWFCANWQTVGPLLRTYAPSMKLGGPAVRRIASNSMAHIQTWTNAIFAYKPTGSSTTGCYQWLDFLDFHYYRDGVTDANGNLQPDPRVPLPSNGSQTPTPAQELLAIKQVAANNGHSNFDVWCTETGWDIFSDGTSHPTVSTAQQSDYINGSGATFDQHRLNGGSHVIVWVANVNATASGPPPAVGVEPKTIVATVGGTFQEYQAYTDWQTYIANYPQWTGGTSPGTWAASQNIGNPSGYGWLLDPLVLNNQQFLANTWSTTLTLQAVVSGAGSGTLVGDIHVRVFRYSAGTYTSIVEMVSQAQTIGSTSATFTASANGILQTFNSNDHLYADIWVKISTNSNGSTSQAIRLLKISTDTSGKTGDPGASLVSPGYQAVSTGGGGGGGTGGGTIGTGHYTVTINDQPVFVVAGSLTINSTIGKRSTASFMVLTDTNTHFQQYQQVNIFDTSANLLFAGFITSPKEQKPGFQPSLVHSITCVDQHFLADKRIVAASYTNKTAGYMVNDILTNILSTEGVQVGTIYDGPTPSYALFPLTTLYPGGNVGLIPSATFVYCTVAQALDELAKQASAAGVPYYWQIDQNSNLYFVPYTSVVNSNVVDGTKIDMVRSPTTVTRANPTYRNTQYLLGGVAQTSALPPEIRVGDGNTRTWTMGYALNSAPTISVNGTSKSVGTKGSTGFQFYWAAGDPVITQDTGQAVLTSAQTLSITYIGQYPITITLQNTPQVSYQASVDGTSGIIEEVEQDTSLTSYNGGFSEASAFLARYATQGTQLQFTTLQTGYAQGQLLTVNLPMHNLSNAQMLVESVVASDSIDGWNIWFTVTAVQGPYDVTWVDFFSKLLINQAPASTLSVGLSGALTTLVPFTASITPTATLTVSINASTLPNLTLHPSNTLYPNA